MSVCMWWFLIICNCIYSVVINCGWNNNVAVQIVACWNWYVFTSSSWLDGHGEFVFIIHARRDPPSFEWECNVSGRPEHRLCSLKWTLTTCVRVVVASAWHGAMLSGGRWAVLGMVTESFWHHIFTEVTSAREKSPIVYAGCVRFTVDWLFWNIYGSYIAPRPLLSWKKPGKFSFTNMGPLNKN